MFELSQMDIKSVSDDCNNHKGAYYSEAPSNVTCYKTQTWHNEFFINFAVTSCYYYFNFAVSTNTYMCIVDDRYGKKGSEIWYGDLKNTLNWIANVKDNGCKVNHIEFK